MSEILIKLIAVFMLIGGIGLLGVPLRLWQLLPGKSRSIRASLDEGSQLSAIIAFVLLIPSSLLWILCVYVIARVLMDGAPIRVWGGSELAMTLDFLGFFYLLVEIVLIPITIHQVKRFRPR